MASTDIQAVAAAIAQHHAALALPRPGSSATTSPGSDGQLPFPTPADADELRLALGLCDGLRQLGFIEADVAVVAQAWLRQTRRTGTWDVQAWPDEAVDFGLTPVGSPEEGAFPSCPMALGLYAVLPDAAWVGRMAAAGVPTLQLRFKHEDPARVRQEVRAAIQAVAGSSSLLFINDHGQIAIEEGAYGVHLGQEDLDIADLDAIRRAGLRLGLSTHGYAEMLRAAAHQPSYIAMGAVFPTTLKAMPTAPQGLGRLGAYARLMRGRSVVAIGGIDERQFPAVRATGVGSIAVVRAITAAADPEGAARHLMTIMSPA
jgi:thiamine-phosphate pyrophosphorylase